MSLENHLSNIHKIARSSSLRLYERINPKIIALRSLWNVMGYQGEYLTRAVEIIWVLEQRNLETMSCSEMQQVLEKANVFAGSHEAPVHVKQRTRGLYGDKIGINYKTPKPKIIL